MATRREAREWVLELLFQLDANPTKLDELFPLFWETKKTDMESRAFTEYCVKGVMEHRAEFDATIQKAAEHWNLTRMNPVDRNVMRMALFEMQYCEKVPPAVSINEAVDIAKYYSNNESGRFVNGILDRLRKEMKIEPDNA